MTRAISSGNMSSLVSPSNRAVQDLENAEKPQTSGSESTRRDEEQAQKTGDSTNQEPRSELRKVESKLKFWKRFSEGQERYVCRTLDRTSSLVFLKYQIYSVARVRQYWIWSLVFCTPKINFPFFASLNLHCRLRFLWCYL